MFKSKSSSSSSSCSSSKAGKAGARTDQIGAIKQDFFSQNCHRIYSCIHCRAHLANHDELISKLFQGNHGRAYLFNKVVNIGCKQAVQRELLTGLHAVADIYCDNCETTLGWKYEQAFVPSQKYKEGKYIIELVHMLKENTWDPSSYNAKDLLCEAYLATRSARPTGKLEHSAGSLGSPSPSSSSSSSSATAQDTVESNAHLKLEQDHQAKLESLACLEQA